MLRRNISQPVETIDRLREQNLRKHTEVYSADGQRVGVAMRFVHRPILEVDEDLKLYRTYLIVQSIFLGGFVYLPTVFIGAHDPQANRLTMAVDFDTIQEETWNREPRFASVGVGVYEELPE